MSDFKHFAYDGKQQQRDFRFKLWQSFPRYVAYCGIMRACRPAPQFRLLKPVVIGLVLPEGADMDIYEGAVQYAAHGPSVLHGGHDGTEVLTRTNERWSKSDESELSKALIRKRRIVLVAQAASNVPDSFRIAADAVVEVGPVLPSHIIAAAKLCLKVNVTPEQAEFIATVPLSIIASTLRRGRPVSAAISLMKKATAAALKPARTDVSGPRLDDLHGLGEAGEWGRELATDLADWRAGKISWAEVDRGVLVSGPPGTGKTTFAQALARTCDVHLVLGSLARWQAKGHLGDLLKAMRAAFDEARKNAPSIIFIDEIDSVGDREKFSGDSAQYCTEVVAALLECIDGAEGREGIVVVGACNHPQRLDAALVRPGRLDRHVRIPLPNQKGREGILRWHLAGALESADLSGIVSRTEGWSGAALEQLVRDGRRMARRARRPMTLDDLATSLPSRHPLPPSLLRRAAIHEAGHVVIALALGRRFESVELRDAADRTLGYQPMGGVRISQDPVAETTVHTLLDDICILLGGLGAEGLVLGNRSVGGGGVQGSDLHRATLIALRLETSYGLGRGLAFLSTDNELDLLATLHSSFGIRERVEAVLAGQMKRTLDLLEHHKAVVERLTDALLERMRLTPAEVSKLIVGLPTVGEWISQ